ncbi:DUF485 domain-containing protein [Pseudomonas sp. EpS/L25]|uniref:DUF485 domain-containing protein n=1 Tax=Pseudomonas sp. EpS/L25 TaxID=1749078 RepID=UPI000743FF74|nr:DUF485 domain-containing protein [Pseudomonas sp. EpS/L25]KUM43795.1 hypothetical protein AR540_18630 [Pseudomonas sp. EpS/L25]
MSIPSAIPWELISRDTEFVATTRAKARLVTALLVIAALYYFALPLGASLLKPLFQHSLVGELNVGLVFALSQYPVGGLLALAYLRGTRTLDARLQAVRQRYLPEVAP